MPLPIKPARNLIAAYLRWQGFAGITLPWAIYLLPESMQDAALIRHERVHERQYAYYGTTGFLLRYFWYQALYGYENNPLEIEARQGGRCD